MRDTRVQQGSLAPSIGPLELIESAALRSALEAFRLARSAAVLLAVFAAVVLASPAPGEGQGHIAASLAGLAMAIYIARGGRRQLRAALNKNAEQLGMTGSEARLHAEALFEVLTRQDPEHALSWVPYRAPDEPYREPVRERPPITITSLDCERLSQLLRAREAYEVPLLDGELARAHVVPCTSIAPDVVTMNSRVRFAHEDRGEPREITLVYPEDASLQTARVSVLSPLGSALLGLKAGQAIEWPVGEGRSERYRVLDVAYQPEAAGDFHL